MIISLFKIIFPVFFVIGIGYICSKIKLINSNGVDQLLKITQNVFIPIFLFVNIIKIDLKELFNLNLLVSFYSGALVCFILGIIFSKIFLKSKNEEAVLIGFCALFSNSVIMGLPITELAYGKNSLDPNFSIIAFHAPFCYLIGISFMEILKEKKSSNLKVTQSIVKLILTNALTIGIVFGFIFNVLNINIHVSFLKALDLISNSSIPLALFALGGVLIRYKIYNNFSKVSIIAFLSLILHPLITMFFSTNIFSLSIDQVRSAVITASMAPGINAFLFSTMYKNSQETSASAVLICTPLTILSTSFWIYLLEYF